LHLLFAVHENRILDKGLGFSFRNQHFVLPDISKNGPVLPRPGDPVTVVISKYFGVRVLIEKQVFTPSLLLPSAKLSAHPKLSCEELSRKRSEAGRAGKANSPWGRGFYNEEN